jgi:outer membrane lipoprotein carrier protein
MKKNICILVMFLSFGMSPWARAASLIDQVQDVYRLTETFRANFVQKTHIAALDRDVEERGELSFSKPGKFSIRYQGDRERNYISDGKTLWIYRPRDKEVEVYEKVNDMVSREALAFLGGLGEMTKEFKSSKVSEDQIKLVPKRTGSPFSEITLTIDPATHLVAAVRLLPKSGNQSQYVFSNVRTNEKFPEKTFQFHESGVKETRPMEL